MPVRIQGLAKALTSPLAAGSLPLPSLAGDGVDITTWRSLTPFTMSYDSATVYLTATAAATLGDASNPVYVCGYRAGSWWIVGMLDGGSTIVFPAGGLKQARRLSSIGIFERLAIACATLGGTTYQYQFEPIAEHING